MNMQGSPTQHWAYSPSLWEFVIRMKWIVFAPLKRTKALLLKQRVACYSSFSIIGPTPLGIGSSFGTLVFRTQSGTKSSTFEL